MDLVLFGIQGSGKGTQAAFLWEKYRFLRFGSGHALREIVREGISPHTEEIKQHLQTGTLVPDEVIFDELERFIQEHHASGLPIIFDGLPRNSTQLEKFQEVMKKYGRTFQGMYFDISLSEALARISLRKECSQCGHPEVVVRIGQKCSKCGGELIVRDDDENEAVIMKRFETFYLMTFPVIASMRTAEKLLVIPASQPPLQVFSVLDLHIQKYHYAQQ